MPDRRFRPRIPLISTGQIQEHPKNPWRSAQIVVTVFTPVAH
jgi:hypothetical protein